MNKIVLRVLLAAAAIAGIVAITRLFWTLPYEVLGIVLAAVALAGGLASLRWRVFVALVVVAMGVVSIRAFYAAQSKDRVLLVQRDQEFQRREAERDKRFDQKLDGLTEGFQEGIRIASLPTAKQIAQAYRKGILKIRASELSEQIKDFLSDWTGAGGSHKGSAMADPPGGSDEFAAVYNDRFSARVTKIIEELKDFSLQDAKLEALSRRQDQDASSAHEIADRLGRLAGNIRD